MAEFFKNLITFGAYGREEKKLIEYNALEKELDELLNQIYEQRLAVKSLFENLIYLKKNAIKELKKIEKLSKNILLKDRDILENELDININTQIKTINSSISIAGTYLKSAVTSISTVAGTYALVGAVGTASTGASIASLSGAAATNATLAWFGGGSLAAGGGGMAAGTVVLGSGVGVLILASAAVFNHLKANKIIKEIGQAEIKIIQETDKCKKALLKMNIIEKNTIEITDALLKETDIFKREFKRIYKLIYPWGIFSKIKKHIIKLFTKKYFTKNDLVEIQYLSNIALNILSIVDKKIIDENGNPIQY